MSDLVGKFLAVFIAENEGQEIDLTGAYGPQSPDLIAAYIQALTGSGWRFEYPYARDLWEDTAGSMTPEFERIERFEQLRRGDVLVFDTVLGPGTVGIYTGISGGQTVDVFTQNPGPASVQTLITAGLGQRLLGAWRLTAGAECVKEFDEYAKHRRLLPEGSKVIEQETIAGYPVTTYEPPKRSFLARLADSVRGK